MFRKVGLVLIEDVGSGKNVKLVQVNSVSGNYFYTNI